MVAGAGRGGRRGAGCPFGVFGFGALRICAPYWLSALFARRARCQSITPSAGQGPADCAARGVRGLILRSWLLPSRNASFLTPVTGDDPGGLLAGLVEKATESWCPIEKQYRSW